MKEREEIVSSTGGLGLQERSYNRLYLNWRGIPITQATTLEGYFRRIARMGETTERRDVFRGLVTTAAIAELTQRQPELVEAAFPIEDDIWYLTAARRSSGREPLQPVSAMAEEIRNSSAESTCPVTAVKNGLAEGYTFMSKVDEEDVPHLLNLWGETFGWEKEQIQHLAYRFNTKDPSVWFSATKDSKGEIVAAAMAERIRIQRENGDAFDVVESTEWRSIQRDHMKAVVDYLHAQIIGDYAENENGYVIVAECNIVSRAYRVGQKSGMVIPPAHIAGREIPQILVQNVQVVDGKEPEGLRDFAFMYLPKENFTLSQAREILSLTGGRR